MTKPNDNVRSAEEMLPVARTLISSDLTDCRIPCSVSALLKIHYIFGVIGWLGRLCSRPIFRGRPKAKLREVHTSFAGFIPNFRLGPFSSRVTHRSHPRTIVQFSGDPVSKAALGVFGGPGHACRKPESVEVQALDRQGATMNSVQKAPNIC